ncbi:hypothetical protein PPYR_04943 [Photinus pyralis]|uniref:Checkpoint protein n=1 Tax=Photinus pyralis TaxID=7054 RepID=A0A1Y1KQI5_PHOPY|nr:cell cycle checkpoint protein RAD1-like [Photinus pyralis]KAB0802757.1 hypothetical protein PPYR_04943 [Photinus pyralis]
MDPYFTAELTDFKIVVNVLKAITFKEFAILRPMEEGLKVTVDEMKCVETSAYIPHTMFTSYHVNPQEDIKFKISLKVLTDCLYIYGDDGNPCLKMTYKGPGSPLSLLIKHNDDIKVDCKIYTLDIKDSTDFLSLADECTLNKIVVNANQFVDILSYLDNASDELQLDICPSPPHLTISTVSAMGESQADISRNSEMVLLFQCDKTFSARYTFGYIKQIFKVMSLANKISISTGESGLLGLQLVINEDTRPLYVEYYVSAMFESD